MRFFLASVALVSVMASPAHADQNLDQNHHRELFANDLSQPLPLSNRYNNNVGSQALLDDVAAAVDSSGNAIVKSYVVLNRGQVAAEYYATGQDASTQNNLFSVNKGFTSIFVAMLINQNVMQLDETLADIWPETDDIWVGVTDAELKQAITIEQLLDSTSGFDDPSFSNGGNTLKEVLEFPVKVSDPDNFNYLGFANVLSYAIQERVGQSPQDWAATNFFPFLGMSTSDYQWTTNADDVAYARNGLSLKTLDMAKFGQLLLQKGKVKPTTRLIKPKWTNELASSRVPVPPADALRGAQGLTSDDNVSYSLMYWNLEDLGTYCAFGFSGQYICVWPKLQLVAAITCNVSPVDAPPLAKKFLESVTTGDFKTKL